MESRFRNKEYETKAISFWLRILLFHHDPSAYLIEKEPHRFEIAFQDAPYGSRNSFAPIDYVFGRRASQFLTVVLTGHDQQLSN